MVPGVRSRVLKAHWGGLLAGLLVSFVRPASGQVRILFVGNSFTHGMYTPVLGYNAAAVTDENYGLLPSNPRYQGNPAEPGPWGGVPGIFKQLAAQAGLAYEVHIEAVSNTSLQHHYANALAVIRQSQWDQVVLQEYSTTPLPLAHTGQPALFNDYATRLEQAVHGANPAARLYLFQTWGRADLTYPSNQPYSGYPIDTMTQHLHAAYYRLAGRSTGFAAVAPVGDAWLRAMQAGVALRNPYNPSPGLLNLWAPDNLHASRWGSYLTACVLFCQLTGLDPRTLGGTEQAALALGIAAPAAIALQQIAYQQVNAPNGPLPVVLTAFAARRQAAGVTLRWATASEQQNTRFEVQRSADGTHFAAVATVPGHGSTSQPHSYLALDRLAPSTLLYYRLRQVDSDATAPATCSPVIGVAPETAPDFALFPNPARDLLVLASPTATAYRVFNHLGQMLLQGPINGGSATFGLATLPPGIYHVETETSTGRAAHTFVRE